MTVPRQRSPEPVSVPISRDAEMPNPAPPRGITVVDIFSVLLRYRVMIAVVALLLALATGVNVINLPRYYSTDAEFMPQGGSRGQGQLSGIARQFGFNIGSDGGDTPQFYMDLVTSRAILGDVAKKDYEMKTDSGVIRGNLIRLFGGATLPARYQSPFVVEKLKDLIDVKASPKTGVITLTVRAPTPDLSTQIANNVLVQINTFNLNRRQQQAGAERVFIEKRQDEASSELRAAEGNLQSFLLRNRDFARSPTLRLEYNRLTRAVDMRQTVYTTLAAAYEQAKIEEVRDLPVITVLAPPETPFIPESKKGVRKVAFAILVGLAIGAMLAFARAGLAASTRGHPNDVAEFDRLKKETVDDLRHPWRPLVRLLSWRKRQQASS